MRIALYCVVMLLLSGPAFGQLQETGSEAYRQMLKKHQRICNCFENLTMFAAQLHHHTDEECDGWIGSDDQNPAQLIAPTCRSTPVDQTEVSGLCHPADINQCVNTVFPSLNKLKKLLYDRLPFTGAEVILQGIQ